jgi:hypothetical protein
MIVYSFHDLFSSLPACICKLLSFNGNEDGFTSDRICIVSFNKATKVRSSGIYKLLRYMKGYYL